MDFNTTDLLLHLQGQLAHIEDDRSSAFVVATAICLPLAWIAVCLRFLSRYYTAAGYGWDDWTIVVSLILGSVWIIDDCLTIISGNGRHLIYLLQNPAKLTSYSKNVFAIEVLYYPSLFAIKLSILLLYGRIFANKTFHIGLWIVGSFTAAYTFCAIIVSLTQCTPLEKSWNPIVDGTCININPPLTTFASLNIVTDFLILMMPISMVWNLHTNWVTKIQISGLFLTGGLVTGISIARVVYTSFIDIEDPSWTGAEALIWAIAEISTAIISACLPTYRPLFDKSKRKASHEYSHEHPWSKKRAAYSETDDSTTEQSLHGIQLHPSTSNTSTSRGETSL